MKPSPPGARASVWLVEDHADSRRVLARVLNRASTMQCPCAFASCEEALAALRLAPRFADSPVMDAFDFDVRKQIPNSGIGGLKGLLIADKGRPRSTEAGRLLRKIDRMAALEEWRALALEPKDWALRMRELRPLFRAARPADGADHEWALEWRGQAAALDAFEEALDEAAEALDGESPLGIEEFWKAF